MAATAETPRAAKKLAALVQNKSPAIVLTEGLRNMTNIQLKDSSVLSLEDFKQALDVIFGPESWRVVADAVSVEHFDFNRFL